MSERHQAQSLRTARLNLEPIKASHADEAWPYIDDARMWAFFPNLRPRSLADLRSTYTRWESPHHAEGELRENWACRDRETGNLVGTMQATTFPAEGTSHIAYGIFVTYQRQGYAREAVEAVLHHLKELHVSRILAEMDVQNEASLRLVESLGFKRLKKHRMVDSNLGVDTESYLYDLIL